VEILVADDDPISRGILETHLLGWGHQVRLAEDGAEACALLERDSPPLLAILDWMMPKTSGLEICRKLRQSKRAIPPYIILLTARNTKADLVEGLEGGADDYIVKPFDREELRVRVQVGVRFVELQSNLAHRVQELQEALLQVKQLQGLLPICAYCKKIRDDNNYWQQIESYISNHTEAQFTHGICPDCYQKIVKPQINRLAPQSKGDKRQTHAHPNPRKEDK